MKLGDSSDCGNKNCGHFFACMNVRLNEGDIMLSKICLGCFAFGALTLMVVFRSCASPVKTSLQQSLKVLLGRPVVLRLMPWWWLVKNKPVKKTKKVKVILWHFVARSLDLFIVLCFTVADKAVARWKSQPRNVRGGGFGADIYWSQSMVISTGHAVGVCTC